MTNLMTTPKSVAFIVLMVVVTGREAAPFLSYLQVHLPVGEVCLH